jgi:hypothetical protein
VEVLKAEGILSAEGSGEEVAVAAPAIHRRLAPCTPDAHRRHTGGTTVCPVCLRCASGVPPVCIWCASGVHLVCIWCAGLGSLAGRGPDTGDGFWRSSAWLPLAAPFVGTAGGYALRYPRTGGQDETRREGV